MSYCHMTLWHHYWVSLEGGVSLPWLRSLCSFSCGGYPLKEKKQGCKTTSTSSVTKAKIDMQSCVLPWWNTWGQVPLGLHSSYCSARRCLLGVTGCGRGKTGGSSLVPLICLLSSPLPCPSPAWLLYLVLVSSPSHSLSMAVDLEEEPAATDFMFQIFLLPGQSLPSLPLCILCSFTNHHFF